MSGLQRSMSRLLAVAIAIIFVSQDMANMSLVHDGLKASKNREVHLGNYQEIRIRQFHQTIDKYLAR